MRLSARSFVFALMCLVASNLCAQSDPGFIGESISSRISLLTFEPILLELKVEPGQREKLKELIMKAEADLKLTRQTKGQETATKLVAQKYQPLVAEILRPTQVERLDQILLQMEGTKAYHAPAVIERLKISKQQQDDMAAVLKRFRTRIEKLPQAGNPEFHWVHSAQQQQTDLVAVLTAEQQAEFAKLKGPAFDTSELHRVWTARLTAEKEAAAASLLATLRIDQEVAIFLMGYPAVQMEIKATDDQIAKLENLSIAPRQDLAQELEGRSNPPSHKGRHWQVEWDLDDAALKHRVNAGLKQQMAGILDDQQMKRLNQIDLQAAGMYAYIFPEVADELKLSKAQQDELLSLIRGFIQQRHTLDKTRGRPGTEEFTASEVKVKQLCQTLRDKLDRILSPEQRQQFTAMKGREFDIEAMRRGESSTP